MRREGKKYVMYLRVSTEMQVDGYSLEGQANCITRYADREEMVHFGTYEDAGKSGKSIEGRPEFKRMLNDIKNGLGVDYVIVYKLSRFGRNAADILNSLELIQSYGVELICVEEGIDSSQTSGKLLISILSAVAEIERENILEQTMNGRKEKARQGKRNGGPPPFGYQLVNNELVIDEKEAEIVRLIYDRFVNTKAGYGGIAKYLNLQGFKKRPHQRHSIEDWSGHFIKIILDNPVYCGKIAFGRRTKEKVKGTKAEYRRVETDDYILSAGKHEGIVSEEMWNKAREKRIATGVKWECKQGRGRSHLLTGILRCPKCGGIMYCNRHEWTNRDGTYKDVYYYYCGHSEGKRGKICDYKAKLRKTDIEPLVVEAIKLLVVNETFAKEVQNRISQEIDTTQIDTEIDNYEKKLKEVIANKTRLEHEIDTMPMEATHRERKIADMTKRLDSLYDTISEIESCLDDAYLRKESIEKERVTVENIYEMLKTFGAFYDIMTEEERRDLVSYLIKEVQIYPNDEESKIPLKSIEFNFPVYVNNEEVNKVMWEKDSSFECVVLMSKANT